MAETSSSGVNPSASISQNFRNVASAESSIFVKGDANLPVGNGLVRPHTTQMNSVSTATGPPVCPLRT
ncbi:hypothetical protein T06_11810 [Trichinella sp. T6]|nr:hypothetical protein T06_11810 [Trichinella sp. T6]